MLDCFILVNCLIENALFPLSRLLADRIPQNIALFSDLLLIIVDPKQGFMSFHSASWCSWAQPIPSWRATLLLVKKHKTQKITRRSYFTYTDSELF